MQQGTTDISRTPSNNLIRGRTRAGKTVFLLVMLCLLAALWLANAAFVKNGQIQLLLYILAFYGVARFALRR
jgi:hypothetical protein